jgi:hypothetical protein
MIDRYVDDMEADREGLKSMHKEMSMHGGEALSEFQESNGLNP